jgi:hypothetical protein
MQKEREAQMSNSLIGKIYYQKLVKDPNYFRTIYIRSNPFNGGQLQPMSSEFIYGEPPPEMEQIPPLLASRLFRI